MLEAVTSETGEGAAHRGGILVVHKERKTQRTIQRILGATRLAVDACDTVAAAAAQLDRNAPRLVVLDHRLLATPEGVALAERASSGAHAACLILLSETMGAEVPRLFSTASLTNLLVNPMPMLAEELSITALKLLRRDLFGLEKYLTWGAQPVASTLADAQQRSALVEELGNEVRRLGLGSHIATLSCLVADELLSNALYNAPVDEKGVRVRVDEPRHSPRKLEGRDVVTLRHACDGRYLAIEVADQYGSLERSSILANLARAVNVGAPDKVQWTRAGAGMGLGLVYSCCTHLVFNIATGRRTEVIALLDVRFQPRGPDPISSFNVFVEEGGEP
jgi:CheY-like chemotaxis protein